MQHWLHVLSFIKCKIQIVVDLGILVLLFMIDGWRNDSVLYHQDGNGAAKHQRRPEDGRHRFRRTDVQFVCMITKYIDDGFRFRKITYRSGCAVDIDIVNLFRFHFRILKGIFITSLAPSPSGWEAVRMICISRETCAYYFSIDLCTTSLWHVPALQEWERRTFTDDETVAAFCWRDEMQSQENRCVWRCIRELNPPTPEMQIGASGTTCNDDVRLCSDESGWMRRQWHLSMKRMRIQSHNSGHETVNDGNVSGCDVGNHFRNKEQRLNRGPRSGSKATSYSNVRRPPIPAANMTPIRSRSSLATSIPNPRLPFADAMANWL